MKQVKINGKTFFVKPKVKYYNYIHNPNLFLYFNVFGEDFDEKKAKIFNDTILSRELYEIILNEYQITESQKERIEKIVSDYLTKKVVNIENSFDAYVWNIVNQIGTCLNEYGLVRISYNELKELEPLEYQILVILQNKAVEAINQRIRSKK